MKILALLGIFITTFSTSSVFAEDLDCWHAWLYPTEDRGRLISKVERIQVSTISSGSLARCPLALKIDMEQLKNREDTEQYGLTKGSKSLPPLAYDIFKSVRIFNLHYFSNNQVTQGTASAATCHYQSPENVFFEKAEIMCSIDNKSNAPQD